MFEHLNSRMACPIEYLEFGVFTGLSIRRWVELNTYMDSRFYGFDTFTGLPEAWKQTTSVLEAGHFSTGGKTPDIKDARVRFVVGRFQESLELFLRNWSPTHRLVLHLDADMYSSTLFVLCTMHRYLKPGTIVMFDEFSSVDHEFRAYIDFICAFHLPMKPVAWAGQLHTHTQMAFEVS